MVSNVEVAAAVIDGGESEVVRYPTDEILLRVHGAHGGNVQVAEYTSEDREGAPMHSHEWAELEYVIEGTVEFRIGAGDWLAAGPGSVQLLPPGVAHSVRVPSGTARVLMVTIGAPYDAFARDVAALYAGSDVTSEELVATAARHGVRLTA
jgi:quercetin dioxygenase-like cupin family protein